MGFDGFPFHLLFHLSTLSSPFVPHPGIHRCYACGHAQNEWTFESDVRRRMGCRVFALDPTVNHKAELADGIHFLKWAAPSPSGIDPLVITGGDNSQSGWFFMPPPLLAQLVAPGNTPIPVLKMDCEGCEYALYDSVMHHNPGFFMRVDQFVIEVHLSKSIGASSRRCAPHMDAKVTHKCACACVHLIAYSTDYTRCGHSTSLSPCVFRHRRVLNYGRLLGLLHKSGHRLQHSIVAHCSPPKEPPESLGVVKLFQTTQYHRSSTAFGTDGHCHNYLFARVLGTSLSTGDRPRRGDF